MNENIVPIHNTPKHVSPFESIKRFTGDGQECWYGRELMPLLGYAKWQRFQDAIERAIVSCENSRIAPEGHFIHLPGAVSGAGRTGDNYCLSRHACNLIVMAADPRKEQIANAQAYFSIQIERAEKVIPEMSEELQKLALQNENLKLQNENMKLELLVQDARQRTTAAANMLRITAPSIAEAILNPGITIIEKVEHVDRTVIVDPQGKIVSQLDGIGITAIQKQFNFKSTKAAWDWLESIGYGKNSGHWMEEQTAHPTAKLPRSVLPELRQKFGLRTGDRQFSIGEDARDLANRSRILGEQYSKTFGES